MAVSIRCRRSLGGFVLGFVVVLALLPPASAADVEYTRDVKPILDAHCGKCHGMQKQKGGLRFDSRAGLFAKGDSGEPAIVPGKPAVSELVRRISSKDETLRMPPGETGPTSEQIATLMKWIEAGAVWAGETPAPVGRGELVVTAEDRNHWAFRPLSTPDPNATIDRFLLAKLRDSGLSPAPKADARTLLRRITFDLTGLPPTSAQIDAFLAASDRDPEAAWEAIVDRLLASPAFGERWARHWLDVARYADSNGQEADQDRPNAYHYRDFVIRAFNDDLPFDTFVRWQLAGDEYAPDDPRAVAATGFLAAGTHTVLADTFLEEERLRNKYNELDDIVATTGGAFFGLTLGCARCHDHKYDPVPSRDYYRLLAAFHSGNRAEVPLPGAKGKEKPPVALVFRDSGPKPATTWLFGRGDFSDRNEPVDLGFLTVLTNGNKSANEYLTSARSAGDRTDTTFQRRALADWATDIDHGAGALVARVIVNRLWQHHFGEGLVRTPNDFGVQGDKPSHPELLDWLAADLVAHGWKLKRTHKLIVMSDAYRRTSVISNSAFRTLQSTDPENRLLGRVRPRRLEAEALRDAMLAVSGTLNPERFGPAFKAPVPSEAMVARNIKGEPYPKSIPDTPAVRRRSVYMFHKRVIPYPLFQAFDAPDALQCTGKRNNTTVAPQALALLNDPFVRTRAADFANRLAREAGTDFDACVGHAYRLAFGRPPRENEKAAGAAFLTSQAEKRAERESKTDARREALADYCQVLFGLNEFLYVD